MWKIEIWTDFGRFRAIFQPNFEMAKITCFWLCLRTFPFWAFWPRPKLGSESPKIEKSPKSQKHGPRPQRITRELIPSCYWVLVNCRVTFGQKTLVHNPQNCVQKPFCLIRTPPRISAQKSFRRSLFGAVWSPIEPKTQSMPKMDVLKRF